MTLTLFLDFFFQEKKPLNKSSCNQTPICHLPYELFHKPKITAFRIRTEQPGGQVDFEGSLTVVHAFTPQS